MENVKDWHIEEIAKMYKKGISIVLERSKKYATEDDPFLNFRRGAAFANTTVTQGIMTRIGDKLSRLQNTLNLEGADDEFADESFDDTIIDLCNYLIILRNWRQTERRERAELKSAQLHLFDDEIDGPEDAEVAEPGFVEKAISGLGKALGVTVD